MIFFNLTALIRETSSIQGNPKTREIFRSENLQKFTSSPFPLSIFNQNSRFISSLFSSITALKYFKKKAMADITTTFLIEEDEEPMATEPIYLSSDESEDSTPNTTPDHQLDCIYPDSINQLIASQLEQRPNTGTETVFYPPTPNMSMIFDDEDSMDPLQSLETPNNIHRTSHKDAIIQYKFANMCNLFQTRLNHHARKIKVQQTSSVHTISLSNRQQFH